MAKNIQIPSTKSQTNSKLQNLNPKQSRNTNSESKFRIPNRAEFAIGILSLDIVWDLGFGYWNFLLISQDYSLTGAGPEGSIVWWTSCCGIGIGMPSRRNRARIRLRSSCWTGNWSA